LTASNRELAAAAAEVVDASGRGLTRRAAGSALAALTTTRTPAAARKVLRGARLDDDVRAAALDLINQLTTTKETS
jgi:hypothetical protein